MNIPASGFAVLWTGSQDTDILYYRTLNRSQDTDIFALVDSRQIT